MNTRGISNSSVSVVAGALATAILMGSSTDANALLFDQNITPDVIFGSGNANGSFTVDKEIAGVELGLRAKIPFVGTLNSNGNGTYSYTLAETDHDGNSGTAQRWNFDWTVNTDHLGTTGNKIDDFTYKLGIDFDPSLATNFLEFDPITPSANPFPDHAIGDNTTANGGGAEATDAADYLSLIGSNNVAQNSWRHSFFPFHPTLTYDPTIDGTYDISLIAIDPNGGVAASTQIQVIIGAGGVSIPEPGTLALFGLGLAGIGFARRRKAA